MKVAFPFQYITTNKFGKVFRPYAKIHVLKKDLGVWLERILVVDTGADFTIFPRKDAFLFGINLEKETTKEATFGVGGKESIFLYPKLQIKMGGVDLTVPAGFLDTNDVPALLGRQLFLELFNVSFTKYTTIFEKP